MERHDFIKSQEKGCTKWTMSGWGVFCGASGQTGTGHCRGRPKPGTLGVTGTCWAPWTPASETNQILVTGHSLSSPEPFKHPSYKGIHETNVCSVALTMKIKRNKIFTARPRPPPSASHREADSVLHLFQLVHVSASRMSEGSTGG